jgi:hypothetical protein
MPDFENVPPAVLVDAVEKLVAKMHDADLASSLRSGIMVMPLSGVRALVASTFDAFRNRGESSEDAAEGASTQLSDVNDAQPHAVDALIAYASENPGLLKEAVVIFAERHTAELPHLPDTIVRGIGERLQAARP